MEGSEESPELGPEWAHPIDRIMAEGAEPLCKTSIMIGIVVCGVVLSGAYLLGWIIAGI